MSDTLRAAAESALAALCTCGVEQRNAGNALRAALAAAPAPAVPATDVRAWTLLLVGPKNGLVGAQGDAFPNSPAHYERVNVYAAQPSAEPVAWVPVTERVPKSGQTVLACYTNAAGMVRRIRAEWVADKTIESDEWTDIGVYDEATDTYYDPEGWYEKIDNWDDYSSVAVHQGEVTHWMPLPAEPGNAQPAAQPSAEPLTDARIYELMPDRSGWEWTTPVWTVSDLNKFARAVERAHGIGGKS